MEILKIILITTMFFVFPFKTIAQEGWTTNKQGDALVYTPNDLAPGKTFKVIIPKPMSLQGQDLKQWFLEKAKEMQSALGKPLKLWEIKPDKTAKWSLSNAYLSPTGKKLAVGYQGGIFENGNAFIMQTSMENDFALIMKYGVQLNTLRKEAETVFVNNPSMTGIASTSIQKKQPETKIHKYEAKNKNANYSQAKSYFKNWIIKQLGNEAMYMPPNLKKEEYFSVTLFQPQQRIGITHSKYKGWFKRFVHNKDLIIMPGQVSGRSKINDNGLTDVLITKRKFHVGPLGSPRNTLIALYVSERIDKNTAGVFRIIYSGNLLERYQKSILYITALMKEKGNQEYITQKYKNYAKNKSKLSEKTREKQEKKEQKEQQKQKKLAIQKAIHTAPNQGVKTKDIEALLYETVADYSSQLIQIDEFVYLLLKDGSAYRKLNIPPSDFNITGAQEHQPEKWGKWKKTKSDGYQFKYNDNGKWKKIKGQNVLGNTTIKSYGYYKRMHAYGNPIMGSVSTSTDSFTLTKEGRFESSNFSLFTGGGWTPDVSVSAATSDDKEGKQSSVGAIAGTFAVDINKQQNKNGSDKTGSYRIEGHTIEFHHDSGRVSRQLFFAKNNGEIFIEYQYYHPERQK